MGIYDEPKERKYKYNALYNGIHIIEKEILRELSNPDYNNKSYKTYEQNNN